MTDIYGIEKTDDLKDLWVGIDLHSNNHVIGIQDSAHHRVFRKKLENDLKMTKDCLERFKKRINAITVESTFNWYWLVDGLMEAGYDVRLAHPARIRQYNGLKHTDDKDDAFFLAHLLCLGLLPEGFIYPKEERQVRDLNRKCRRFIQERTSHILSLNSLFNRNLSKQLSAYSIKKLSDEQVRKMISEPNLLACAMAHVNTIRYLSTAIEDLEKLLLSQVTLKPEYQRLLAIPGIGKVLAISIALETGLITRFPTPGDYISYCRCVGSLRKSNDKIKGHNNRKNGNPYLAWTFMEAADKAKRYCPHAKAFFERKVREGNIFIARKALASKYARACYYMLKDGQEYDVTRVFESAKSTTGTPGTPGTPGAQGTQGTQGTTEKNKPKPKTQIKGRVSKPYRGLDTEPSAPIGIAGATTLS